MAEILWYKLEDNAANTTVVDNANNSLTGVASANTSTLTAVGKVGNCFDFVLASSEEITLADNALLNFNGKDFSVAYWVNPDAVGNHSHVAKGDNTNSGWIVGSISTNDTLAVIFGNGTTTTTYNSTNNALTAATWQHVAVVYNRTESTLTMYVDGVVDTVHTGVVSMLDDSDGFAVGSLGGSLYFNGLLDDVRIYGRCLSIEEVEFLHNSGSGTAVPLDGSLKTLANVTASKQLINAATATGANVDDDANKNVLAVALGNTIKIIQSERPVASPA